MIIPNGTIEFKVKQPAGIDPKTGYPIKVSNPLWSAPVSCQFQPVSLNLRARIGGEPVCTASYTVLIEEQPLPDSEQLRLIAADGKILGEFSLHSPPELLQAVGEIKITI